MTTDTDIANATLIQLGVPPIEDIDTDNGSPATTIAARIALCKDIVMRSRNWNSATHRIASTAEASVTPAFDYTNSHILPTDPWCLRVIEVYQYEAHEWVVEGRRLLINASSIKLKYIKRITDTAEYDPMLAEAISSYLAYATAYKITGSRKKEESAYDRYKDILKDAGTIDGLEGAPPVVNSDHFEVARL